MRSNKNVMILIIFSLFYIILFLFIIMFTFVKNEEPNELYKKMKDLVDKECLIGLDRGDVIDLLNEPMKRADSRWLFSAGQINKKSFLGQVIDYEYYILVVYFNEENEVEKACIYEGN